MQRWLLPASALTFAALAAGSAALAHAARGRDRWPEVDAVLVARRVAPLPRGSATFVQGRFSLDGASHTFEAPWGRNTWADGRWVAPADLPPDGATVRVRYNPARPSEVALGPDATPPDGLYFTIASGVLAALSAATFFAWWTQAVTHSPRRGLP